MQTDILQKVKQWLGRATKKYYNIHASEIEYKRENGVARDAGLHREAIDFLMTIEHGCKLYVKAIKTGKTIKLESWARYNCR